MSIRIATAPVSWGILEIEGWTWRKTYTEVLDEMVQAGYSGTELGPHGFLPTNPSELKRELGQRKPAGQAHCTAPPSAGASVGAAAGLTPAGNEVMPSASFGSTDGVLESRNACAAM